MTVYCPRCGRPMVLATTRFKGDDQMYFCIHPACTCSVAEGRRSSASATSCRDSSQMERDSRHRAFVVRLVRELADLREPVGSVEPGDDEWASRLQRAARRWLKVVEGSGKR